MNGSSGHRAAPSVHHPREVSPAAKQQLFAFFADLERELEKVEFFRPPEKRDTMTINLRNIFARIELSSQDIRTLHGVIMAIAEGRKGPARGGVLSGEEAHLLRTLLGEHAAARVPSQSAPVAGWPDCSDAIRPTPNGAGPADLGPPVGRLRL